MIDGVILKDSEIGKGIYANKNFLREERVLTFQGIRTSEKTHHTLQIGLKQYLLVYEPWRYVNHSCDPNCGIKDLNNLVAMRTINNGEEITFDYAMAELDKLTFEDCLCGSQNCRGKITGFRGLPDDLKKKYNGFISSYLLDLENPSKPSSAPLTP
jgi:hypothetical protein